jgi:hypothetical protein
MDGIKMINNDDDWIDLFELTTNWSTQGFFRTEIYAKEENVQEVQVITTLFRQIVRKLGFRITNISDYRSAGNEPLERTLYTNIPNTLFHSKRDTLFEEYKRTTYSVTYQDESDNETLDLNNDDPAE